MLRIAYRPLYRHPLPPGHRFPMLKYELIPEQLLYEGTLRRENLFAPDPVADRYVLMAHHADYYERLKAQELTPREIRRMGFPLSPELVHRERVITGGTIQAAHYALEHGAALNVSGGTHHAFTDRGEGFCLLNDMAVAACYLLDRGLARQILFVDLDVHQGNGSAEIFRDTPAVYTFSMHGQDNYPLEKERSDWDLPLPSFTEDRTYLGLLADALPQLMRKVRPDFVFFQAGVDVLATDRLGRLGLSLEGCRQRDRIVFETCRAHSLPVVAVMGGGYSPRITDIVSAHCNTFRLAQEIFF